jgi:AP2 domain
MALRNFPEQQLKPANVEQLQAEAQQERGVRAKSGYLGVRPPPRKKKKAWATAIVVDGKYERLGSWANAEEAAEAYDRAVLKYRGKKAVRNFPKRRPRPADAAQLRAEARQAHKARTGSRYRGVSPTIHSWSARVGDCFVGTWPSEEKAAEAHDRAMLFLGGPAEKLNFPSRHLAGASPSDLRKDAYRDRKRRSNAYTSRYVGVSYNPANGSRAWQAALTNNRKQRNLGYWKRETDAARVHDRAVLFYKPDGMPLNFPDEDNSPANAATLRAEAFREGKARYSSSFRGVHYDQDNQCWIATITYRYSAIWIGRFGDEREAALAFDAKAIELRGLNARVNFDPRTGKPVWGKRLRELSNVAERDR